MTSTPRWLDLRSPEIAPDQARRQAVVATREEGAQRHQGRQPADGVADPVTRGVLVGLVGLVALAAAGVVPWTLKARGGDSGRYLITSWLLVGVSAVLATLDLHLVVDLVAVSLALGAFGGMYGIVWPLLMDRAKGANLAGTLALTNTVALIGAFLGPFAFGLMEGQTGSSRSGLSLLIPVAVIGLMFARAIVRRADREGVTS
jgi:hypothetical protein